MTWAIYTLARHPDIQSRLRAKIRAFLPPLVDTITPVTVSMLDLSPMQASNNCLGLDKVILFMNRYFC